MISLPHAPDGIFCSLNPCPYLSVSHHNHSDQNNVNVNSQGLIMVYFIHLQRKTRQKHCENDANPLKNEFRKIQNTLILLPFSIPQGHVIRDTLQIATSGIYPFHLQILEVLISAAVFSFPLSIHH